MDYNVLESEDNQNHEKDHRWLTRFAFLYDTFLSRLRVNSKCGHLIGSKIVLIDGEQLTSLMIEHDVGVSTVSLYPVKKVDSDYFEESI